MATVGCGVSHKDIQNIGINAARTKQNDETTDIYLCM
jgi:hypothetical protein